MIQEFLPFSGPAKLIHEGSAWKSGQADLKPLNPKPETLNPKPEVAELQSLGERLFLTPIKSQKTARLGTQARNLEALEALRTVSTPTHHPKTP